MNANHEANPELRAAYEERERQRLSYLRRIRAGDIVQDVLRQLMADPSGNGLVEAVALAIAEGRDGFAALEEPRADTALAPLLERMESLERAIGTLGEARAHRDASQAGVSASDAVAELSRRFGAVESKVLDLARSIPAARRAAGMPEGSLFDRIAEAPSGEQAQASQPASNREAPAAPAAPVPAPSVAQPAAPVPVPAADDSAPVAGGFDERAYRSSGLGKRGARENSGAGRVKAAAQRLMLDRNALVSLDEIKRELLDSAKEGEDVRAVLCPNGEVTEEHFDRNVRQALSHYASRFQKKDAEYLYWNGDLDLPEKIPDGYRDGILLPRSNVIEARAKIDQYNNLVQGDESLTYRFRRMPGAGGKGPAHEVDGDTDSYEEGEAEAA